MTRVLAACISRKAEEWNVPDVGFYCHTDGWKPYKKWWSSEVTPREYIDYLASRRNSAVEEALHRYPEATDLMMIDSHYLGQWDALNELVKHYEEVSRGFGEHILGAATWALSRTRLSHILKAKRDYFDKWAAPDARWMPYGWRPENDLLASHFKIPLPSLYRVHSVGGVYLFPRTIWEKGVRYGTPEDLHGCEHNWLCEHSNIPIFLDLNVKVWRKTRYSLLKCARCSISDWRRRDHPL